MLAADWLCVSVSIISDLNVTVRESNAQDASLFTETDAGLQELLLTCYWLSSCAAVWTTSVSVVDSAGSAMAGKVVYLLVREAAGE